MPKKRLNSWRICRFTGFGGAVEGIVAIGLGALAAYEFNRGTETDYMAAGLTGAISILNAGLCSYNFYLLRQAEVEMPHLFDFQAPMNKYP